MNCAARTSLRYEANLLPSLKEQLSEHGIRADKRFGQHFLLDGNITDKITRHAGNLSGINVIEIGPGPGGLTRSLLKSDATAIYAIEKDSRLLPLLTQLAEGAHKPLNIIEGDALKLSLPETVPAPRAIIANLPYNVGTPMLIHWLHDIANDAGSYESLTIMLQKEVVERIIAKPNSKNFGRLSVISQWLCEAYSLFDLPPKAFTPPPKVDSSIVQLVPRKNRAECNIKSLEKLTAAAFGQRRKMLRSSLKSISDLPEELLNKCNIEPTLRAEALSLQNFIDLSNKLDETNYSRLA